MYIIKEQEDGTFEAVYSHWGADLVRELAFREEGITKGELYKKLIELMEKEKKQEEALITKISRDKINDFVDFEDIGIEVWAILYLNGDLRIYITIISNDLNGAVEVEFKSNYSLRWAFEEADKWQFLGDFLKYRYKEKEKIEKEAKKFNRYRFEKWHLINDNKTIIGKKPLIPLGAIQLI